MSREQRTKLLVTGADISILLHQLWRDDSHEYDHDRTRVQLSLFLCLEEGSGQRGGTFAESSGHRGSNQSLWYKDISFYLKKRLDGSCEFLLQVGARFRKNHRNLTAKTKDLVSVVLYEQGEHWRNGILYFIALALADRAVKSCHTVEDLLMAAPRNGDVWKFQWNEDALEKPVFQMITQDGPTAKLSHTRPFVPTSYHWAVGPDMQKTSTFTAFEGLSVLPLIKDILGHNGTRPLATRVRHLNTTTYRGSVPWMDKLQ